MKTLIRVAVGVAVTAGLIPLLASAASGHQPSTATVSCASVSATFTDFGASDHPIVWHVQVGAGAFQTVATAESPPGFVGSGVASADITALTDQLNGSTATVSVFATWPGGQSATTGTQLTCGTSPVSPTAPTTSTTLGPQVGGIEATAPASSAVVPAVPVPAAVTFTG
jgi:hypothetical protein